MLAITPSLSSTISCSETRSPCTANEQITLLASPHVLSHPAPQFRVFLDSCFSSQATSNPSANLLGSWCKCDYSQHPESVIFLLNWFNNCLWYLSFLHLIHTLFLTQKKRVVHMPLSVCVSPPLRTLQWLPLSRGLNIMGHGTSLAVQWWRLCLPVKGVWV